MTPLGYILLPVGIVGLFVSKKWLYRLFVFWTLFSATSAANFGDDENGSGLQVWMLFGFLWLLRLLLDHLSILSFAIDRRILRPCFWLVGFLAIASFSLIMPVYINGRLAISSPILGDFSETPLYLTSHNFTQLLYLIFGGIIAICVAHSNLRDEDRQQTEKVILLSAIFISVWGLFQFFCNATGFPYPDYIFNNSGSATAKGFMQTLDIGVGRISSVTVEPSEFAKSLITLLPLTFPAWLKKGSIISRPIDRLVTVLFILLLVLSTSSTAYFGLLALAIVTVLLLLRTGDLSLKRAFNYSLLAVVATSAVIAAALTSIPIVSGIASTAVLDKSSSGSGLERVMTIQLAFEYFQKYPFLGIGWGSAGSHDLIVKLLSNVGIIGTVAFFGAMGCVVRANWRALEKLILPVNISRWVWLLALIVFLIISAATEFPLVFGNFWLILGMAIATSSKSIRSHLQSPAPQPIPIE